MADRDQRRRQVPRSDHQTAHGRRRRSRRLRDRDGVGRRSPLPRSAGGASSPPATSPATFLPELGDDRRLARAAAVASTSRCPAAWRRCAAGATLGMPLLAPWANRLATRRYRAAGVDVDLAGLPLGTDDNGLPIHGRARRPAGMACRSTATTRPAGRLPRRHRRRRSGVPVPAPHRGGRRPPATRQLTARHDDHPDRTRAVAGRLRMAPLPAHAGHRPRRPLAAAAAGAHRTSRSTTGHPDRQANRSSQPKPNRSAGGRSTTSTGSAGRRELALVADDVRDLDARRDRVSVRPGVGARRPPVRRARADDRRTNSLVDGTAPLVEPGDSLHRDVHPHHRRTAMTKGSRR